MTSRRQPHMESFEKTPVKQPTLLGKPKVPPTILSLPGSTLCSTNLKTTSAMPLHQAAGVVSVQALQAGNVPFVLRAQQATQQQAPSSTTRTNLQPAGASSACAAGVMIPRMEPQTDREGRAAENSITKAASRNTGRVRK